MMSFSFEFQAETAEEAAKILTEEYAPDCVKAFITIALAPFPGKRVFVSANGHLYNNDYQRSNANIVVQEVLTRKPKGV